MSVNPYSFPHDSYLAFFLNATPPPSITLQWE